MTDEEAMALALAQARTAAARGEVPVGAVVLHRGQVVATGANAPIGQCDPTAHAEVVALRAAARALGNYRLEDCELFVTLEPCAMCSGAMLHARLARVVYGAADPKTGAAGSVLDLFAQHALNHRTRVRRGVLGEACGALLREFFQQQRQAQAHARVPLREDALRTAAERFAGLADYPWHGQYIRSLPSLAGLSMHYLDERGQGGARALTLLCVHGAQGWSHDFRTLLPVWREAGHRVVAVDLPGFGMSDKPKKESAHSPAWHRAVLAEFVQALDLHDIVLVLQGRGGLLALDLPERSPARYCGLVALAPDLSAAVAMRPQAAPWPAMWQPARVRDAVELLRKEPRRQADDAPFPDAGHRAGPRALQRWAADDAVAPDWSAAQPPPAAGGDAALAQQLLDGFAVGYFHP
nr:tRNA adenosine(34) deaminase TadA [Variovorax boronicumulans]